MRRLHRSVLLFLLAWLPLQAVAGPLLAGCCPDAGADTARSADPPCHEHAAVGHDAAPPAGDSHDGHDNPGHLCCPHFTAAPAPCFDLPAVTAGCHRPADETVSRSHVPDPPQRPPRA